MNAETRMLEPGEIEPPAGQIRFLFLAGPELFAHRAERLRLLAKGHPLGEYLTFLALLADAQHHSLHRLPAPALPDLTEQALCREHGMPLLSAGSRPRDPVWRDGLTVMLQEMGSAELPTAAREAIAGLLHTDGTRLEELADKILTAELDAIAPQELPFIAAALQLYWVRMTRALGEQAFGRLEQGGLCPVCGSPPVAGVVHAGGTEQGLRYLCCSLCATQWHLVRVTCGNCASTRGITLHELEGANGAIRAEGCDECNSYLKLLYLEKDPRMEAVADDLASLALDLLMDGEHKERGGPNLFFHPGTVP